MKQEILCRNYIENQQVIKCAFVTWRGWNRGCRKPPIKQTYYLEKFIELLFIRFY